MPERIQLQRTKGWRLPEGAIKVARPTRWGNPFRVGDRGLLKITGRTSGDVLNYDTRTTVYHDFALVGGKLTAQQAVLAYRLMLETMTSDFSPEDSPDDKRYTAENRAALETLRGHDLACWCPLIDEYGAPVPCHADVLLELANEA